MIIKDINAPMSGTWKKTLRNYLISDQKALQRLVTSPKGFARGQGGGSPPLVPSLLAPYGGKF